MINDNIDASIKKVLMNFFHYFIPIKEYDLVA